ncbi:MAG: YfhO family protein [Bacteroidales bacterium]|nr:YfhO family protein [Bacteroidales bacterium]
MNKTTDFKSFLPYVLAILAFVVMAVLFVNPILEGKRLKQSDVQHYKGMSQEVQKFREQTGEEALWTNRMFGGMPAYQISVKNKNNVAIPLLKVLTLNLPSPANMIFLYFIGFFILMMVLQRNIWIGIFGAIAFALSSYFIIIIEAGHNTKALAIGLMPPLFAGVYLLFRKKYILGFILTAIFTALQLRANHLQITYYLFLILLAYGISELIYHVKMKEIKALLKAVGLMVAALIIAIGVNMVSFWMAYEAGQHSTRGEPVLSLNKDDQSEGLDPSYILAWSYGKNETLTILVPDFMGGASQKKLTEDSESYKTMVDRGVPPQQARKYIKQGLPTYWGKQPFTSGPVYVGALIFFLFVFGMFIVQDRYRWWILAITVLAIFLSWGKNMEWFSEFFIHYFPAYNKFRAVSMILVIPEFTLPLMAVLALIRIYQKKVDRQQIIKALKYSTGIVGGLLIIILLGGAELFSFVGLKDAQMVEGGQIPGWLMDAIRQDRIRIMRSDAFRSLIIVLLGAGTLWLWVKEKLKAQYALLILIVVTLLDLWLVDRRYLNKDNFVSKREMEKPYSPSQADLQIMQDPDPNFRVFSQLQDPFREARTSYFHNSIGGYHGAKLQRYQDMIDYHLSKGNMDVFNMLNTKYFISRHPKNKKPIAQRNPGALGHAWFVANYKIEANPDSAIKALNNFDPEKTAIVEKQHATLIEGKSFESDTTAKIKLENYQPNHLIYKAKSTKEQLAVFSELYYPEGWQVYIDDEKAEHFRVNYILRGMIVPPGEHKIEFEFKPDAYYTGRTIAAVSSVLLIVILLGGFVYLIRSKVQRNKQIGGKTKNSESESQ